MMLLDLLYLIMVMFFNYHCLNDLFCIVKVMYINDVLKMANYFTTNYLKISDNRDPLTFTCILSLDISLISISCFPAPFETAESWCCTQDCRLVSFSTLNVFLINKNT